MESLVHPRRATRPEGFVYGVANIPDELVGARLESDGLEGYGDEDRVVSRLYGDAWLDGGGSVATLVPGSPLSGSAPRSF